MAERQQGTANTVWKTCRMYDDILQFALAVCISNLSNNRTLLHNFIVICFSHAGLTVG